MQPHSMCAVALAGFVWNHPEVRPDLRDPLKVVTISRCNMTVEFRHPRDGYRHLMYNLTNIERSSDDLEMKFRIVRSSGGTDCNITMRRNSRGLGAEVQMTHYPTHIAGLVEVFDLNKQDVTSGRHRNSEKYRNFSGDFSSDRKTLMMYCEILRRRNTPNEGVDVSFYKLDITGSDLEVKQIASSPT